MQGKSSYKEESREGQELAALRTELATLAEAITETEKRLGIEVHVDDKKSRLDYALLSGILAQQISDVCDMQKRMNAICEEAMRLRSQLA